MVIGSLFPGSCGAIELDMVHELHVLALGLQLPYKQRFMMAGLPCVVQPGDFSHLWNDTEALMEGRA